MRKRINVVGAVIVDGGKVLAAQRSSSSSLPNLWEFPGGKIEADETPQAALVREIAEELDCEISVHDAITTTVHEYEFAQVTLTTYWCRLISGVPTPSEHAALAWLAPSEFERVEWAPADVPALALIEAELRSRASTS